jgi:hypothetical protein
MEYSTISNQFSTKELIEHFEIKGMIFSTLHMHNEEIEAFESVA